MDSPEWVQWLGMERRRHGERRSFMANDSREVKPFPQKNSGSNTRGHRVSQREPMKKFAVSLRHTTFSLGMSAVAAM
jgi:hypothetical protein